MWDAAKASFAVAWIGLQGLLIGTAGHRADGAFGFRMFSESSTIEVHLFRVLGDGSRQEAEGGEWVAKDAHGTPHRISWSSHVREPNLSTFAVNMHASYGAAAQIERWTAAAEYVARHIVDDAETRALELELHVRRNGRAESVIQRRAER